MRGEKKTARPRGADSLKKKAFNAWLCILEVTDFITGEAPGFLTPVIVSLLTVLAVLKLTGRL